MRLCLAHAAFKRRKQGTWAPQAHRHIYTRLREQPGPLRHTNNKGCALPVCLPRPDKRSPIMDLRSWIPDHEYPIMDPRSWVSDRGSPIMDLRLWISDNGSPIMDLRSWISDHGFQLRQKLKLLAAWEQHRAR